MNKDINKLAMFLKEKGFVYPGSSIYGGLANSWDYGPLGALLKENLKREWTNFFIKQQPNNFLLDSSILLNRKVWKASGHEDKFNDPLIDCKHCKTRYRADHLLEDINVNPAGKTNEQLTELIAQHKILCPKCETKTNWTEVRNFELMFKAEMSKNEKESDFTYLRPETAQGVFINFTNVVNSLNPKIPFAIGQIGKAFRNEITPGNFIFRTKEFEQMEYELFVKPSEADHEYEKTVKLIDHFIFDLLKINKTNIRKKDIAKDELAHYSSRTIDYEYQFPFGWKELLGFANRTDFDLKTHEKFSSEKLSYRDHITNEKYIPYILEASFGVERLMLALLSEAYFNETLESERQVLKLPFELAPYKLAIASLSS